MTSAKAYRSEEYVLLIYVILFYIFLLQLSKFGPRAQGLAPSGADGRRTTIPWAGVHGPGPWPWTLAQSPITDHADNYLFLMSLFV